MFVRDFEQTKEINTDQELDEFLARRHENDRVHVNSFWMCYNTDWPALSMMVREDLAGLVYMADSEGTVFVCQGQITTLPKGAMTLFWLDDQRQPVLNDHIISFAEAARAAKEFLHAADLPKSIKWMRL